MGIITSKSKAKFHLARVTNSEGRKREEWAYRIRFEKALILSLTAMIILFLSSQKIPLKKDKEFTIGIFNVMDVDMVPQTKQGILARPPRLPQIPIPTEDEFVLEDETIELTVLDLNESIPVFEGFGNYQIGSQGMPRPVSEIVPEYPRSERRKGVEGIVRLEIRVDETGKVDSVRVVENTTSSQVLEENSILAAYKSRYMPAKRKGQNVSRWIKRLYRFEKK